MKIETRLKKILENTKDERLRLLKIENLALQCLYGSPIYKEVKAEADKLRKKGVTCRTWEEMKENMEKKKLKSLPIPARQVWGPSPFPPGAKVIKVCKHPKDGATGVLFLLSSGIKVHGSAGVIRTIDSGCY